MSALSPRPMVILLGFACGAPDAVGGQTVQDPALRAYVEQVDREWPGESHQQMLTAESLQLLATAIASLAERNRLSSPALARSLEDLRTQTRVYAAAAPGALEQTRRLRLIFIRAAEIIERLVNAAGLETPVAPRLSALRRSAESLDSAMRPLRQPDVIERFFHHAAEALQPLDRS